MKQVPVSQEKFALVDDEDYKKVCDFKWTFSKKSKEKTGYVTRFEKGRKRILMHRMILGIEYHSPVIVDHINGDGLDNRKKNLRLATIPENGRNRGKQKNNTSGYKGVSKEVIPKSLRVRWKAQIQHNRKQIHLGMFDTPEEAHMAYVKAAKKFHGEFANSG